jgi:hypothetical protein
VDADAPGEARPRRTRSTTGELAARIRVHRALHPTDGQKRTAQALGVTRAALRRASQAEHIQWGPEAGKDEGEGAGSPSPGEGGDGGHPHAPPEGSPPKAAAGPAKPLTPAARRKLAAQGLSPEPEAQQEAAQRVHVQHSQRVASYAAQTYEWIVGAGREIWDLWDRSGYKAEWPDPESFVRYVLAFFSYWYPRLALFMREHEELQEELAAWETLADPARRRIQARLELLSTILTAHTAGTPMTRDEIWTLHEVLSQPLVSEEEKEAYASRADEHTD